MSVLCDAVSDVDVIFTNCTVDIYFWTSEHCLGHLHDLGFYFSATPLKSIDFIS